MKKLIFSCSRKRLSRIEIKQQIQNLHSNCVILRYLSVYFVDYSESWLCGTTKIPYKFSKVPKPPKREKAPMPQKSCHLQTYPASCSALSWICSFKLCVVVEHQHAKKGLKMIIIDFSDFCGHHTRRREATVEKFTLRQTIDVMCFQVSILVWNETAL